MKRRRVFQVLPGWDASPSQSYPSIKFAGTIYKPGWRGHCESDYCLAQELKTMYLARAETWTTQSGD